MIIVKLIGGLGNQMFQYAAARALALRLDSQLLFDIGDFEDYRKRKYRLHYFDLPAAVAHRRDVDRVVNPGRFMKLIDHLLNCEWTYYREKGFTFDPAVLHLPDNIYLDGYWQSEKYFVDASATIRDEFALPVPSATDDSIWLNRIHDAVSVSVHVRRGDYVTEEHISAVHGTCPPDYRSWHLSAGLLCARVARNGGFHRLYATFFHFLR